MVEITTIGRNCPGPSLMGAIDRSRLSTSQRVDGTARRHPLPRRGYFRGERRSCHGALRAENALLRAENRVLIGRLAELERGLGLNSSNSGKPPSSDGLKKPPRVSSLREASGKKIGGQKGHPGETLCQVEKPDATIDHYPQACATCGEPLTAAMATGHSARQVFDFPEPRPLIVTEHRAHGCRCAACGTQTRGAFPEGVTAPVQCGKPIGAFVLYLLHYQLLPEKRLAALMADLFGVKLVRDHPAARGWIAARSSLAAIAALARSWPVCRLIQNCGDVPKTLPRRRAV
jgi:transposase